MADKNFQLVRPAITTTKYPAIDFPEKSNGLATGLETFSKGLLGISDTFANIKDGEEEVKKADLLNNTALALTQAKQRVDTNPDADQRDYLTRWKAEVKPIREQAQEQIRSFETRRQAEHATIQLGDLLTRAEMHATHDAQQLSLDNQRAQGMQSLEGLSRLAARDPDPSGREQWAQRAMDIVHTLGESGALHPTEAVQWVDTFKKNLAANRLKFFSVDLSNQLVDRNI